MVPSYTTLWFPSSYITLWFPHILLYGSHSPHVLLFGSLLSYYMVPSLLFYSMFPSLYGSLPPILLYVFLPLWFLPSISTLCFPPSMVPSQLINPSYQLVPHSQHSLLSFINNLFMWILPLSSKGRIITTPPLSTIPPSQTRTHPSFNPL